MNYDSQATVFGSFFGYQNIYLLQLNLDVTNIL